MKIGSSPIRKLYLGLNEVKRAYLGKQLVFDTSEPLAAWFVSQEPSVQPTEFQNISDQLIGLWFNELAVQEG